MQIVRLLIAITALTLTACTKPCDENMAMNKMLALNNVQGRVLAKGGEGLSAFGLALMEETAPASSLIAEKKYVEACAALDELAAKYKIDLKAEEKDMLTIEELAKDGGKGTGSCSISDAAAKQMEVVGLLQKEVDAGRKRPDIFERFNEDSKGYAEMLSTDPSKACALFDKLKERYGLATK